MFSNPTFSATAKTELLNRGAVQVNLWMEICSIMASAILLL